VLRIEVQLNAQAVVLLALDAAQAAVVEGTYAPRDESAEELITDLVRRRPSHSSTRRIPWCSRGGLPWPAAPHGAVQVNQQGAQLFGAEGKLEGATALTSRRVQDDHGIHIVLLRLDLDREIFVRNHGPSPQKYTRMPAWVQTVVCNRVLTRLRPDSDLCMLHLYI
jgi:hypothetical protein